MTLHTIKLFFDFLALVALGYVVFTFYMQYREETGGTMFQRLVYAARDSVTILWSKFVYVVGLIVFQLDNIADFAGVPEAKNFIDNWIGNPKVVSGIMLVIAFITIRARLRPGSSAPVAPLPSADN